MQLNNVLRSIGIDLRVNFKSETEDGLVLCLADPNDSNFMIDDKEGKMWAIDFGHACFLPPSFVSYSLTRTSRVFIQRLARRVNYPPSDNVRAMSIASGRLIIFNDNTLGAVVKRSTPPKVPLMAASNLTED
ncbi:hypothetical protein BDN70DRAFT_870631 [Pholiota conissans]|uniref:Uncharacterized protein n=1 Tax=Pholiota conissans TaxID=109636 RepID=A0A9P5ZH36_9AGAR|nr:hypothetical protein BDN70DRAFT_870631 [Pholiota conissans]